MNTPDDSRRTDHAPQDEYADVRRAYAELGDEPVPPSLDVDVLQRARAAVRPARARPRWIVPVSLAASVVLAVGVALDVRREAGDEIAREIDGVNASENAAVVRDTAVDETAEASVLEAAPVSPQAAAPPSSATSAVPAFEVPVEHGAPSLSREAADTAADAAAVSESPAAEGAAPARGESAAGRRKFDQPRAIERERAPAAHAAATAPPPAAAPAATPAAAATPDSAGPAAAPSSLPPLAPEDWLAKIEALRREGRNAEAEAELARFVAAYPDYPRANPPR